jgi:hypothetical protein
MITRAEVMQALEQTRAHWGETDPCR